ncbi:Hcp family type VI secretion system effector [Enterobacter ludwigii]|uniref:Hcp family type VI secretion system effector n=1 Tax=Enterobacter ludwigii TaxID=299767 RepID=UPI003F71A251
MAVPVYLWLKDNNDKLIEGSVDTLSREKSIEVQAFDHEVYIPTDDNTGRLTGTRIHRPVKITKEIDKSSAYLYRAVSTGQTLNSAEFNWFRINSNGEEEVYFNVTLENVRVVGVKPVMHDIKDPTKEKHNHLEEVSLRYEKIIWHNVDGNAFHEDAWNERATA